MIKLKLTNKSCAPILMVRILSFCPHNRSQKLRFKKKGNKTSSPIVNTGNTVKGQETNTTKQEGIMAGKNEVNKCRKSCPVFCFCFVVDAFVVKLTPRSLNKRNHVEIEGLTIYSYSVLFA